MFAGPPAEQGLGGAPHTSGQAQERFQVFAVLASPALRRSGASDLVEAELARLPEVRIVEREQLDAALKELSVSELLGPDSTAKRQSFGRIVKADALVILAEEQRSAATRPSGPAVARVVISDCSTGARLFVGQAAIDPDKNDATGPQDRPVDLPSAVADAVARTRQRYPSGVRWVVGTSPFVNRGLTNDYDLFRDRFAALLNNALSLLPGVAVLEMDEARSIGKEQVIGGSGSREVARIEPLIIEGDFQVTQAHNVPTTRPAGDSATAPELSVAFTVSLNDGKKTLQRLQTSVPVAEVPAFLTHELTDAVTADLQLNDLQPVSAEAQFDALTRRADTFSRLGGLEQSIPLREAALLLRPNDPAQHERLMDEYQRVGSRLIIPGQTVPQLPGAELERHTTLRDAQWQAGLEHLEFLIRNRLINRPQAIRATGHYRARYLAAVPDGPPRLRQYFTDVYPAVLGLEPGKPQDHPLPIAGSATRPVRSLPSDEIDQIEKIAWIDAFFGQAARGIPDGNGSPLTSAESSPSLLGDDASDFLADMIVRRFPGDVFLPRSAGYIFERVPGSGQDAYPHTPHARPNPRFPQSATPTSPSQLSGKAPAAGLDPRRVATYLRFLDRVEKSGKAPYGFWVRLARLRMQCIAEVPAGTTRPVSTELASKIDALEQDYRQFKLHGDPPGNTDPLLVAIGRLRARATGVRPPPVIGSVQVGVPSAEPSPAVAPAQVLTDNTGNHLWFVPLPVRWRNLDGTENGPGNGWSGDEQLLSAGPAFDVIWSSRHVLLWRKDDLIEEVFNAATAAKVSGGDALATGGNRRTISPWEAQVHDVKWDGKQVWVAYTLLPDPQRGHPQASSGLAVIDPDDKPIRWIGKDDGLPPANQGLLIHPISEGRVIAIGSFGDNFRGWCALVTTGAQSEPAHVNVFHTAVAVNNDLRSIDAVRHEPDIGVGGAFRPTWLAECRPPAGSGAPPRLLLVGRGLQTQRWPLVIDLETLKVSVSATPFAQDDRQQATAAFAAVDDYFLEMHNASLYRYELSWDGRRFSGTPKQVMTGEASRKPFERLLPAGDDVYLVGNRQAADNSWLRYNVKSREVDRIDPDYLTARDGPCAAFGYSSRFGLVGWGQAVCRLVVARERPAGALQRRLFLGPIGIQQRFEPDDAPSAAGTGPQPLAATATRTDSPTTQTARADDPTGPGPALNEMIAQLDIRRPGLNRAMTRLAEMSPDAFAPEQRREISAALLPLLTIGDTEIHPRAIRAFAVWHSAESEALLLAKLQDADAGSRWSALEALGACRNPATIPAIVRQIPRDASPALACLVAIGPDSEPAVLSLLTPSNSIANHGVINALAIIGTSRSVPALQSILDQHPDRLTTELTRQALEMIQTRRDPETPSGRRAAGP